MKRMKKPLAVLTAAVMMLFSVSFGGLNLSAQAEEAQIPLSILDVVYAGANINGLVGDYSVAKALDGDEATYWQSSDQGYAVFDLGAYYNISQISVIQTTGSNNSIFAVYGTDELANIRDLGADNFSSPYCIYGDKAGGALPINTKRTFTINGDNARGALNNVRYLKVFRGLQVWDLKVYGDKIADADDARIPLSQDMVIQDTQPDFSAKKLVDGVFDAVAWDVGKDKYFTLDLGGKYDISAIQMFGSLQSNSATQLDFYTADSLEELADITALTPFATLQMENLLQIQANRVDLQTPATARYVKVYMTTGLSKQFRELRIFGKSADVASSTVSFNPDNGAEPFTVSVETGAAMGNKLPTAPVKDGYAFAGWYYLNNGVETPLTAQTVISGNLSAYAVWRTAYTVTFMNGETLVQTVDTVAEGTSLGGRMPADLSFTEYTQCFAGWQTADKTPFGPDTVVNQNMTVYANWADYIAITRDNLLTTHKTPEEISTSVDNLFDKSTATYYNVNGEADVLIDLKAYYHISLIRLYKYQAAGEAVISIGETKDELTEIVNDSAVSPVNWSSDNGNNIRYIKLHKSWNGGSELSIYGKKMSDIPTFTVSFSGAQVDPISVEKDSLVTLPADPVQEGVTFIGWYRDANFITKFDASTPITQDITLYARFARQLTFSPAEDNVSASGGLSGSGTDLNFLFDNQYSTLYSVGSDTVVFDMGKEMNLARLVFSTYNYRFTSQVFEIAVSRDAAFTNPVTFSASFLKEVTDNNLNCRLYCGDVTANQVRYLKISFPAGEYGTGRNIGELELFGEFITGTETYRVTYDLNGGDGTAPEDAVYRTGEAVNLPASVDAVKQNYKFIGWGLTPDAATPLTECTIGSSSFTLYAVWQMDDKFTVTLVSAPNTHLTYTKFPGETVDLPAASRTGYIFDGWYNSAGELFTGSKYTVQSHNETFTARWKYVLTVVTQLEDIPNTDCGTVTGVDAGGYRFQDNAVLTAVANEGYVFAGWFKKQGSGSFRLGTDLTLTTPISENTTIYARFAQADKHTVSFVNQSGNVFHVAYVEDGAEIGALPVIGGVLGYDFTGWFDAVSGGNEILPTTTVTADMTVYARFQPSNKTFAVEVSGGYLNGMESQTVGSYTFLTCITVTAAVPQGKQFQYWRNANGGVVSYSASYSFEVKSSVKLQAVFGDTPLEEKLPVTEITVGSKDVSAQKISFVVERNIPEGYELVEAGVLVLRGEGADVDAANRLRLLDDYSVSGDDVIKAVSQYAFMVGTTIQGVNVQEPTYPVSIRSYLICRDGSGNICVVYSSVLTVYLEKNDNEPDVEI